MASGDGDSDSNGLEMTWWSGNEGWIYFFSGPGTLHARPEETPLFECDRQPREERSGTAGMVMGFRITKGALVHH